MERDRLPIDLPLVVRGLSGLALAVATLAVLGHLAGVPLLTTWAGAGAPQLSMGTAIAFGMAASALLAGQTERDVVGWVLAAAAVAIVVGRSLDALGGLSASLPSMTTALAFVGLGLLLVSRPRAATPVGATLVWAMIAVTAIGRVLAIGALFGADSATPAVGTSTPTLVALVLTATAGLAAQPDAGPWRLLLMDGPGGVTARWLVPLAAVPVVLAVVVQAVGEVLGWTAASELALLLGVLAVVGVLAGQVIAIRVQASWLAELTARHELETLSEEVGERARRRGELVTSTARLGTITDRHEMATALVELASALVGTRAVWMVRTGEEPVVLGLPPADVVAASRGLPPPLQVDQVEQLANGASAWALMVGDLPIGWLCIAPHHDDAGAPDTEVLELLAPTAATMLARVDQRAVEVAERRSRDALLFGLSHELRTPLTMVLAGASSLSEIEDLTDEDRRVITATIVRAASRLDARLGDLLDIEQLRMQRTEPDVGAVGVRELVREYVAEEMMEVPAGVTAAVDEHHLRRALQALVDNGRTHGGGEPRVEAEVDDDTVVIRVIDHGPGVPAALRDVAFSALGRAGAVSTHAPGVGVGLTLARGLVEANDGTLHLDDTPGGGTTAVIRLPVAG